jgi:histidine triad (HIT) family protein
MTDCLFCKIISGDIPATILYRDDKVIAFNDINPQAPVHTLIIPLKHISTLNDLQEEDNALTGHMVQTAKKIAAENGIAEDGYRVLMNCNSDGGQTVFHLHLHILGGRQMHWPPG